ncbi:MAG: radical SAM protein [Ruminococcus sp.]|nr:radical SAM protein [Ruminococcus sp.]
MDLVREIYRRDMFIEELNTNGYFITQKVLDEFKEFGCKPMIKISFDGVGCHDWMRGSKGAEERTLAAMKLCIDNGFRVMSQTQVHRRNLHTLLPTLEKLNDMGVAVTRLIRTSEAPRWNENAPDSCLGIEEYYSEMLGLAEKYKASGMKMELMIWQFIKLFPQNGSYQLDPVRCPDGEYKAADPRCKCIRGLIGVTSEKDVVPCLQMSGYFKEHGIRLANLGETPLKEILSESDYLTEVCFNLHKFRKANEKCDKCGYFRWCNGGCPALGRLFSGEKLGADFAKCLFFENGWYEKCVNAMNGWYNLTSIKT